MNKVKYFNFNKMFKVLIMFHFYTNFRIERKQNKYARYYYKRSNKIVKTKIMQSKYGTITKQNDLRMIKCPKYKRIYVEYTTLYIV